MISNSVVQAAYPAMAKQLMSTANSQFVPSPLSNRSSGNSDSFEATGKTISSPRFAGRHDQHKAAMRKHVQDGIKLIKQRRFEEALDHFQSNKRLGAMDVDVADPVCIVSFEPPTSVEEAKQFIRNVSRINMAFSDKEDLSIKFARIAFMDQETGDFLTPEPGTSEAEILDYINYEQALMAAEENIHTYQNMDGGKNVTYHPAAGEETDEDHEIDIATTLEKFGLPLTRDFLRRYRGRAEHIQQTEVFDLVQDDTGKVSMVKVPVNTNAD